MASDWVESIARKKGRQIYAALTAPALALALTPDLTQTLEVEVVRKISRERDCGRSSDCEGGPRQARTPPIEPTTLLLPSPFAAHGPLPCHSPDMAVILWHLL